MGKYSFKLNHFALYSKNWYKRFNPNSPTNKTIWDDLKVILKLDGYDPFTNSDIVHIVLSNCMKLDIRAFNDLIEYSNSISPSQCWKNGYYTKEFNLSDDYKDITWDYYTSIIYHCMSNVSCLSAEELGVDKFPAPDYINGLPKNNSVSNKSLKLFK